MNNCLSSHNCLFAEKMEPKSFMRMFNASTLLRQSIKLLKQTLMVGLDPFVYHSISIKL